MVKHFLDVNPSELDGYSRIILSGTTLKDFKAQKHLDKFRWIKTCDKPILGICAGMQIISLVYGVPLTACLQVGMTEITTQKDNPLFGGTFQAYTLHSLSVKPSETFEVLAKSSKMHPSHKTQTKTHLWRLVSPRSTQSKHILKNSIKL